jgi:hypothetical protein
MKELATQIGVAIRQKPTQRKTCHWDYVFCVKGCLMKSQIISCAEPKKPGAVSSKLFVRQAAAIFYSAWRLIIRPNLIPVGK